MYQSDFMSIERTLNVSNVSTFKVLKVFGEQNVKIMLHCHSNSMLILPCAY